MSTSHHSPFCSFFFPFLLFHLWFKMISPILFGCFWTSVTFQRQHLWYRLPFSFVRSILKNKHFILPAPLSRPVNTVESRFNDLRFNDIPGITINIRFPGKSYSKMYGAESRFNDIRFNDIPGLTMGILFPESKIFPGITIKST